MSRYFAWITLAAVAGMFAACSTAPAVKVTKDGDLGKAAKTKIVVIVSDAGKYTCAAYTEHFLYHLTRLTQDSQKQVSIMTTGEFVNSPYAQPELSSAFADRLFVMVNTMGKEEGEYGTYSLKCLMEIKHLGQEPLFTQQITISIGNAYMEASWMRANQFAQTIYDTLKSTNIL